MPHYLKAELYELIKKDESIFDFIQEEPSDGLWIRDLKNHENEWINNRFWKTLGYKTEELPPQARAWQNFITPDDLNLLINNLNKHLADSSHIYDQEIRYKHKNGSSVWIRYRGKVIRDEQGTPVRMLGTYRDITSFKQTEKNKQQKQESRRKNKEYQGINDNLRTSNEERIETCKQHDAGDTKFRCLYENSPFGILICQMLRNKKGEFIDFLHIEGNNSVLQHTGFKFNQLIGKKASEIVDSETLAELVELYTKVILTGKTVSYDQYFNIYNRTLQVTAFPLYNDYFIINFIDISGRKNAEKEVLKQNEEYQVLNEELQTTNEELKEAFDQLGANEKKLKSYINNAPYGVIIADENGCILEGNPAAYRITGYSQEELLHMDITDLLHPDNFENGMQHFNDVKQIGSANAVLRFITKKGENRFWNVSGVKLSDTRLLGFIKDITKRKLAEEKIRESEQRYRLTLDNMLEGCQIISPQFKYLYVNDAVAQHGRKSKKELLGRKMTDVYPGIENSEAFLQIKNCMETGEPHYMLSETTFEDGYKGWFELHIQRVPEGVFVLSLEITERRKAKEELREKEAKLRAALESMSDAVFISDKEGKIIHVNEAYLRITEFNGIENMETHFNRYPDLFEVYFENGEIAPIKMWAVSRALRGETAVNEIYKIKRKDRDYFWLGSYNFAPITINNQIAGCVVTIRDVTDKLQQEKELEKHRLHLEEMVKERTQELEEKNLELERFNNLFIGREFRIKELKEKVKEMEQRLKSPEQNI